MNATTIYQLTQIIKDTQLEIDYLQREFKNLDGIRERQKVLDWATAEKERLKHEKFCGICNAKLINPTGRTKYCKNCRPRIAPESRVHVRRPFTGDIVPLRAVAREFKIEGHTLLNWGKKGKLDGIISRQGRFWFISKSKFAKWYSEYKGVAN